ncbi:MULTISPECIES: ABC transporter permease [unclassified Rhizobium]|jgi:capsular polysaccharide transport system permease protein|uniref:ABC transporter permease n=1 Tax=unclassified Rhizobium TaxID=2613769 RepID=UPI00068ECAA7|nr:MULTISPECIES: ABC transporter permease [unclassified Rhizobium]MBN8952896.1 ABC transporter permease [Rhizobium tropici]OJY76585.1 MAG: sugar ABC transporter permease [Rhizobium sp. 60-20]RKD52620.1 capsular polysaccharide transport system permease protein [Rhizobium sp. WW_1]
MHDVSINSGRGSLFITGLKIQGRVLGALIMREMLIRYGRENIGFLWLALEPMILTTGVMVMWTLLHHEAHGLTVAAFVLSGYMPLTLWRHISGHAVSCLRQNLPLMYHRQIRLADALVARALLEIAGTTAALIVVYTTARLAGFIPPYQDLGLLLTGWLFMAWFSFAVGLIFAAGSERFEFVEKFIPPFQYLTLPICGMFFMVAWLPSGLQKLALYVPTVHCFELFRAGVFGDTAQTFFDVGYLFKCCVFTTAIGLCLVNMARNHIKFE